MAVTAKLYGNAILKMLNKEIDWDTDTIKVALATSSYTPDQDTHDYFNDVTNEITGTGYTAGGATLASKTTNYDSGTNVAKFDAADVTWSSSTLTARYAIIYDAQTGVASTSPLIGYIDFGENVASYNSDFTITFHANGIFTFTVS
jgi:hypothetical protein